MGNRVFDRRGRQNWSAEKRRDEDQRLRERRIKSDRRVSQRRQGHPWPRGHDEIDKRLEERRKRNRRAEQEKQNAKESLGQLSPESSLFDAIRALAMQKDGFLVLRNSDQTLSGVLSDRIAIRAIADYGEEGLSQPVRNFFRRQAD